MALTKEALEQLAMSLEDAVIDGNEDELTKLTLCAMRAADSGRQLWAVATLGPLKEATLGEDVFPPVVLDCVVERALTFTKSADRASAISLAARMTTFSPVALVDKGASPDDKPSLLDALKKHRDKFCAELSSSQASVRAAAALTLGRCGHKDDADLLMLKFGSGVEAGARLVAAAALGASVSEQAERFLADKNLVTRTCAACAIGLVSELDGEACDVLADAMVSKQKLPPIWGWRWRFGNSAHTGTMAATLLRHSKVSEPSRIVDALSGLKELDQASADVLGRLAFASPPELGVTMEDLDDAGRNSLRALCRVERGVQVRSTVHHLGLPSARHIEELIDEQPPFFAPTNVLVDGQAKRWHIARVWRECARDNVRHEDALAAISSVLSEAQVYEALVLAQAHIGFVTRTPEDQERSLELVVSLFEGLKGKNFPLRQKLGEALASRGRGLYRLHLAVGALVAFGTELPAEFDEVLAMGLVLTRAKQPVGRLLAALDDERRAEIGSDVESRRV